MQDLLVAGKPAADHANGIIVLGMPGSGKTGLMLDAMALSIVDSPLRAAAQGSTAALPRLTHDCAKIMVHKSGVTHNIGYPTETCAKAMCNYFWEPAVEGRPAGYVGNAIDRVAGRKLHVLEEVQAWVQQLPHLLSQHQRALQQANAQCESEHMLRRCRYILACDPHQSPCKTYGIKSIDHNGRVQQEKPEVVMPWTAVFNALGQPSASMHWHIFAIHGQRRLRGLGFRLLHNAYAPRWLLSCYLHVMCCDLFWSCCALPTTVTGPGCNRRSVQAIGGTTAHTSAVTG